MLHAAEGPGIFPDDLVGDQALHRADGRHVVLHIVPSRQEDVCQGQHRALPFSASVPDGLVTEEAALNLPVIRHGKVLYHAGAPLGEFPGDGVVPVADRPVLRPLEGQNVGLGLHVLRHVGVDVQVVGGQVGEYGDVGALSHGHELEGAQLHHRHVLRPDRLRLRQQRVSDVAPQVDRLPRRPQEARYDGGGGGLAVAAGDGEDGTGTHGEKGLHLRGDRGAPLRRLRQEAGMEPRGAEDHVGLQALQIVRAQAQAAACRLQLLRQSAQGGPVLFVADGHVDIRAPQETDERGVADAHPDHRHFFPLKGPEILLYGHMGHSRFD